MRTAPVGDRSLIVNSGRDGIPGIQELNVSKPIVVRRALSANHGRLIAIQSAALRGLAGARYDKAIIDVIVGNSAPMLDEMIAHQRCFVAECGGMLAGWGGWYTRVSAGARLATNLRFPPPYAEVRALYVDPAWVNRGFGRRLLTAIEGDMVAGGHRHADLIATLNSVAFFERFGYRSDTVGGTKPIYDTPPRWLDMSKGLEPSQTGLRKAA